MSARRASRTLIEAETLVGPPDADACTRSGAQPLVRAARRLALGARSLFGRG